MSEWISIEDRKPKKGQVVLIYSKYGFYNQLGQYQLVVYTDDHGLPLMFHSLDFMYGYESTHWMNLPEPPEEKHE